MEVSWSSATQIRPNRVNRAKPRYSKDLGGLFIVAQTNCSSSKQKTDLQETFPSLITWSQIESKLYAEEAASGVKMRSWARGIGKVRRPYFGTCRGGVPHPAAGMQIFPPAGMHKFSCLRECKCCHSPARSEHLRLPGGAAGAMATHRQRECGAQGLSSGRGWALYPAAGQAPNAEPCAVPFSC